MERTEPQYYGVTVRAIKDFGNDTRHFELALEAGRTLEFVAGQFVAVLCPKDGKLIRRAYSMASPPEEKGQIDLIVKLVQGGVVTNWFWTLKEGGRFKVHGPYGKFILPEVIDFDPIFVAVGTGIAPFRSMVHHLFHIGFQRKIGLLFGARYDTMIPYHKDWLKLAQGHPHFTYIPTVSRPSPNWRGETGYVQTKIEKFFSDPMGRRVYICGLNEMIQAVQEACLQQGYRKDQIAFEKYD